MRIFIVTDIHGNLPALEAVLATPQAQTCEKIVSLGDYSGFGPEPLAVRERLDALHAVMLLGNHEARLHHMQEDAFAGYNWDLARWTAAQLPGYDLEHPIDFRTGSVLMTHGTPGDPFHLIDGQAAQSMLSLLPEDVSLVISGHNHIPFYVSDGQRAWINPGSLGMLEDGTGGTAAYAVLTVEETSAHAEVFRVPYDLQKVFHAYKAQGLHEIAPEMCHAAYLTMRYGLPQYMLRLVSHVKETAAVSGLSFGDAAAWKAADKTFPWADGLSSHDFWQKGDATL
jgi:putative phosphoesterase